VALRRNDKSIGVRRLGFGVSGPHGTPLMSPSQTRHMIDLAFESGVRLFDTAPLYGNGEAERRLGEALRSFPRYECIVSTKAGATSSGLTGRGRDFSPDAIKRSVEASLKRLKVTYIDWLLLHGPTPDEFTDELLKTLIDMKYSGMITSLGVAGRGPELDAALATGQFSVFMAPVHAALPQEDIERLNRIKASGSELVGIEVMSPAKRSLSLSVGSTWRFARSLFGKGNNKPAPPTPMSPEECLWWALYEAVAHRVVMTTTRMDHLRTNIAVVEQRATTGLIGSSSGPSSERTAARSRLGQPLET
jgi:aryl-alcohol dehydrogenase-like predicted oxidoreductase